MTATRRSVACRACSWGGWDAEKCPHCGKPTHVTGVIGEIDLTASSEEGAA